MSTKKYDFVTEQGFLSNFTILYFINLTIQLQLHPWNYTIYSFSTQFHFEEYFVLIFFARVVFN